ncbi:hypothetical protein [Limnobacter sp. P1]|uniref:hypothetical protein n=1 Tax=Limnobacter olei TaxID=3031298 RepID=UPI0023B15945|nr:hypothetical protein [Limnobacter sp. P1]
MQVQIIGMAWYKPENFDRLRTMFEDGHKLHRTYNEWFAAAETGRKKFESQGVRVVPVDIDPDAFPKWCKANGMRLNADARNKYASFIAYQVATGAQGDESVH